MLRKTKVILTERDRRLFNYLQELKVASAKQINRDIFEDTSNKAVYRRLKKLQSSKHIRKKAVNHFDQIKGGYSLSKQCFNILHPDKYILRKEVSSKSMEHDLTLVDVRRAFITKDMVTEYIPENLLLLDMANKHCDRLSDYYSMKSDAVVRVKFKKAQFDMAIEYESHMKTYKRYEKLLRNYYFKRDIGAVLYIVRSREVLKRVQAVDRKLSSKFTTKFYYALLDDVLNAKDELQFTTILDETLTIK